MPRYYNVHALHEVHEVHEVKYPLGCTQGSFDWTLLTGRAFALQEV